MGIEEFRRELPIVADRATAFEDYIGNCISSDITKWRDPKTKYIIPTLKKKTPDYIVKGQRGLFVIECTLSQSKDKDSNWEQIDFEPGLFYFNNRCASEVHKQGYNKLWYKAEEKLCKYDLDMLNGYPLIIAIKVEEEIIWDADSVYIAYGTHYLSISLELKEKETKVIGSYLQRADIIKKDMKGKSLFEEYPHCSALWYLLSGKKSLLIKNSKALNPFQDEDSLDVDIILRNKEEALQHSEKIWSNQ